MPPYDRGAFSVGDPQGRLRFGAVGAVFGIAQSFRKRLQSQKPGQVGVAPIGKVRRFFGQEPALDQLQSVPLLPLAALLLDLLLFVTLPEFVEPYPQHAGQGLDEGLVASGLVHVAADPLPAGRQIAQDRGEALLRCAGGVGGAFDDERKYVVDVVDSFSSADFDEIGDLLVHPFGFRRQRGADDDEMCGRFERLVDLGRQVSRTQLVDIPEDRPEFGRQIRSPVQRRRQTIVLEFVLEPCRPLLVFAFVTDECVVFMFVVHGRCLKFTVPTTRGRASGSRSPRRSASCRSARRPPDRRSCAPLSGCGRRRVPRG